MTLSSFQIASVAANAAEAKKSQNVKILETQSINCFTDYFVVCSGESKTQVRAIHDEINQQLKKRGLQLIGEERDTEARWHLLDYGEIVVHIFNEKDRSIYKLEEFWNHADVVDPQLWSEDARRAS